MGEPRGLMGEQRGLVGGQPRGRGAGKVVQGRLWAVLVKQVWSELNSRLGHGESINPSRAPAQRSCGTLRQCNPEEVFTPGNLHTTGKKVSWLLRGGNCILLGLDLLSAVLGWDCHTHTGVTASRGPSREHCTNAENATRRAAKNVATWKNVGGWAGQSADLSGDATDSREASFSLVYGQTTSTGAMVGGRKKDAI